MGIFQEVQMAMGLAGVEYCDFIVFTCNGLIIARTAISFEDLHHLSLISMRRLKSPEKLSIL